MADQFRELFPFLRDRNPEVRRIALSNLLCQTPEDAPYRHIFLADSKGRIQKQDENDIIKHLKLLCRDQLTVSHDAFRALVNLSDLPLVIAKLSEPQFLSFLVSYIITPNAILADLASMLLSNLSASSAACALLVALKIPTAPDKTSSIGYYATQSRCSTCVAPEPYPSAQPRNVPALPLLVDAFARAAQLDTAGRPLQSRKGDLHFLANVFANISTISAGREFFLTPRPLDNLHQNSECAYPLASIVAFTEHRDKIRRGGVASTIKNCAFHIPAHRAMLSPDSVKASVGSSTLEGPGIDVLPYLLLPLAGPEEFDLDDQERLPPALQFLPSSKTREPDASLRLINLESLILLCTTRWGRDFQRENGVYEIIRAAHEVETVDIIQEHIEKLVNLLKREEPVEPVHRNEETARSTDKDCRTPGSDDEDRVVEV